MDETQRRPLEEAFVAAWQAVCPNDPAPAWQRLVRLYTGPGRYYHDLRHLGRLLIARETIVPNRELDPETMLALFFHDIVYVPGSGKNVTASRELGIELLGTGGAADAVCDRVGDLVDVTSSHRARDAQAQLLIDLDLSGLAGPPAEFMRLFDMVRREWHFFSAAGFARRHAQVMRHFVDTEYIYYTPECRQAMEADARRNVEGFLAGVPAASS